MAFNNQINAKEKNHLVVVERLTTFKRMKFSIRNTAISSLKFCLDATNLVERFFWFLFWVFGLCFMIYVVENQLKSWKVNPILTTSTKINITDIEFPAVTFCPLFSTPLGPMERLMSGIIDEGSKIRKIRNKVLKYTVSQLAAQDFGMYKSLIKQ